MVDERAGSMREYVKQADGSYSKQVQLTGNTDPTFSASEISLLKGIPKQLQGTGSGARSA